MARHLSADEVESEHLAAFGKELGPIYHALYNDVVWLHIRWDQHRLLYGAKPERIDLLNSAAPMFFRLLQDTLFEQTLLDISRLTEKSKMGQYAHLTLQRLVYALPAGNLQATAKEKLSDAIRAAAFARDWRNRRIAHRDLDVALQRAVRPLSPASRIKIDGALGAIGAVLNVVSLHYLKSETVFDGVGNPGDATQLLFVLRDGVRARREAIQRMSEGRPTDSDLDPGSPV
jgi:hypothetical protein